MRKLLLSLVAIFAFASTTPLRAAGEDPSVTTIGTATVYAVPDKAVFSVSIVAIDPDVAKACAKNEADATKLIKAIKDAGIPAADIATDTISISVHYKEVQGGGGRSERDGFSAVRAYSVTLRDLKQIEKLFNAIVQAGVDATPYVNLEVSNLRPFKDQARVLAMKAAQEKAFALSKEVNCTLGKALTINEGSQGQGRSYGMAQTNAQVYDDHPTPDTPETTPLGRIAIQATVTVTFELK